ncbi:MULTISPECIES: hypothetical protein [unclassified Granulicatella]|uniref:hypothetical protein n=1 Tax=unclassified Granulicatella TaxID=2630493 RepID=UPI001073A700|nr:MULTISPECIES: hypothetical protein [unclassified Granulicatella]MBF0780544.1 hypothetical protein [Granulicatella sp. 19428wC4_WM01]TFU94948.1 hypothetical protein E4T68_05490 [Granulicatella sp. WM01]
MNKNIEALQEEFEKLEYWDSQLLDFKIQYLGDEARLYIQQYSDECNDTEYCYEITFLRCYKVAYDTDAGWMALRGMPYGPPKEVISRQYNIKDATSFGMLLGYAAQDIKVSEYNYFLNRYHIVVANMTIDIICQDIDIKLVPIAEQNFFWKHIESKKTKFKDGKPVE